MTKWEIAYGEFHKISSYAGGKHASSYESSNGYEFIAWFEDEQEIPQPANEMIEHSSTWDASQNAHRFQMTLPYETAAE